MSSLFEAPLSLGDARESKRERKRREKRTRKREERLARARDKLESSADPPAFAEGFLAWLDQQEMEGPDSWRDDNAQAEASTDGSSQNTGRRGARPAREAATDAHSLLASEDDASSVQSNHDARATSGSDDEVGAHGRLRAKTRKRVRAHTKRRSNVIEEPRSRDGSLSNSEPEPCSNSEPESCSNSEPKSGCSNSMIAGSSDTARKTVGADRELGSVEWGNQAKESDESAEVQEKEVEEEEMSEYERKRLQRIEENKRLMIATGILQVTKDISETVRAKAGQKKGTAREKRKADQEPMRVIPLRSRSDKRPYSVSSFDSKSPNIPSPDKRPPAAQRVHTNARRACDTCRQKRIRCLHMAAVAEALLRKSMETEPPPCGAAIQEGMATKDPQHAAVSEEDVEDPEEEEGAEAPDAMEEGVGDVLATGEVARSKAWLQVEVGVGSESETVAITRWPFTVGRGKRCDLVINDPKVSALHLLLDVRGGAQGSFEVQDESLAGVKVDGQRLPRGTRVALQSGARISLGKKGRHVLRFVWQTQASNADRGSAESKRPAVPYQSSRLAVPYHAAESSRLAVQGGAPDARDSEAIAGSSVVSATTGWEAGGARGEGDLGQQQSKRKKHKSLRPTASRAGREELEVEARAMAGSRQEEQGRWQSEAAAAANTTDDKGGEVMDTAFSDSASMKRKRLRPGAVEGEDEDGGGEDGEGMLRRRRPGPRAVAPRAQWGEPLLQAATTWRHKAWGVLPQVEVLLVGDAMDVVLQCLRARHLCRLAATCKAVRHLVASSTVWRTLYSKACAPYVKEVRVGALPVLRLEMPPVMWKTLYASFVGYKRKLQRASKSKGAKAPRARLPCPASGCGKTFSNVNALHAHLCGEGSSGADKTHYPLAEDGTRHYCTHALCPKYYPTAYQLEKHVWHCGLAARCRTRGVGNYSCPECQASFRFQRAMDAHFVLVKGQGARCPSSKVSRCLPDPHASEREIEVKALFAEQVKQFVASRAPWPRLPALVKGIAKVRKSKDGSDKWRAKVHTLGWGWGLGVYGSALEAAVAFDVYVLANGKPKFVHGGGHYARPAVPGDLNTLSPPDQDEHMQVPMPLLETARSLLETFKREAAGATLAPGSQRARWCQDLTDAAAAEPGSKIQGVLPPSVQKELALTRSKKRPKRSAPL
jgi:pSer/pThr/pTyr-binding forkhead associated (FHA) protein